MTVRHWFKSGSPWIWLNAGAITISMIMVVGLLALIAVRGFGHFWPAPIIETTVIDEDGESVTIIGEVTRSQTER